MSYQFDKVLLYFYFFNFIEGVGIGRQTEGDVFRETSSQLEELVRAC